MATLRDQPGYAETCNMPKPQTVSPQVQNNGAAERIRRRVRRAVRSAWKDVRAELPQTPLPHWNEAVFRFFVTRSLLRQRPAPKCHTEWNRIDLAVQASGAVALVEFKFLRMEFVADLFGQKLRGKGGPSNKNFAEFCECIEKLASIGDQPWVDRNRGIMDAKIIVLSYIDRADMVGKRSYRQWYDTIRLPEDYRWADRLSQIETFPEIQCPQSQTTLICKLFSVA